MKIAKVVGVTVCTVKEPRLENSKMLLVCDADQTGKVFGKPYIAQDVVGVGPSNCRESNTPTMTASTGVFTSQAATRAELPSTTITSSSGPTPTTS